MKYIKVTNNVQEVNRLGLEKLGLSTKRDNNETIGQFGSGIKFAPIAAIRKGMDWAFAGSDKKGKYVLQYIVKDDDDIPCVFYKYDDYEKPSSFTAEAGVLSWTNDFQIYREVVANAMDESKLNGLPWTIDVVDIDKIESIDGEFSVYFTATDSMLEIHNDFDKYFCTFRKPIYVGTNFSLYEPYDDVFRVYTKGVLVFSDEKDNESKQPMDGYFDYELNNIDLNEERTVSSTWNMHLQIVRSLADLKDPVYVEDVLVKMLNDEMQNNYETNNIPSHTFSYGFLQNDVWSESFDSTFPESVIIDKSNLSFNVEKTINSRGYDAISIENEGIYNFLTGQGIKSALSIFGEAFKYEYTMGTEDSPKLSKAIEIVEDVFPMINLDFIVGIYMEDEDSDVAALGMTLNLPIDDDGEKAKVILISNLHVDDGTVEELVSTLIHEYDHYSTGVGDGDMEGRLFRSLADSKIGNMACEIFKLRYSLESIG